jgi:hypothetical protein
MLVHLICSQDFSNLSASTDCRAHPGLRRLINIDCFSNDSGYRFRLLICCRMAIAPFEKIISGGQTGADRAALDWAINNGMPHGGWCPKGRAAEDGIIPERYHLEETPDSKYKQHHVECP